MTRRKKKPSQSAETTVASTTTTDSTAVTGRRPMRKSSGNPRYQGKSGSGSSYPGSASGGGGGLRMYGTTQLTYGRIEQPIGLITDPGGRVYSDFGWSDSNGTNSSGLFGILDTACILSGVFNSSGTLAESETLLNALVNNLPQQLYTLAASKRLSVTNFFSATLAASFTAYVENNLAARSGLRLLQSLAQMTGYNIACNRIAENIMASRPTLEALIHQLEVFPMPQSLCRLVDDMSGVFLTGKKGAAPFFTGIVVNQGLDLGSNVDLNTVFTGIAATIGNMNSNATDFGNILRLFGFLYGMPQVMGDHPPKVDESMYYMHLSRAFSYQDTASAHTFGAPGIGGVVGPGSGSIPLLVYNGGGNIDPRWLTLARPTLYYLAVDDVTANQAPRGMFSSPANSANGTTVEYYSSQTGTRFSDTMSGAGAQAINLALTSGATSFAFPWAAIASTEQAVGTQVSIDARVPIAWSRYYLHSQDIDDAHGKFLQRCFFDDASVAI